MSLARYIDHTLLKQTATLTDIDRLCQEANTYGFAAVCIPPIYVQHATQQLTQSQVKVATVISFPFGYSTIRTKCSEAEQAIEHGAHELDIVMNLCALKNGDDHYLEQEIESILTITRKPKTVVKVIIESGILSEGEIVRCCEIYKNFPIQFLKTSTGYAEKGASIEAVQLMRKNLPSHIGIKASGGIKTADFAQTLINAGATRLGCSASIAIVGGDGTIKTNY
ncbi:MAG: deoxyribose-phosphate aldolase [Bacteroidota bacterium]|nr:deoxyribose-phosphate aldolase [Bacteroidota bacterium]